MRHSKEPVSIFFSRLGVLLACATTAASFCAWATSYMVFAEIGIARDGHPPFLGDLWDHRWEVAVVLGPGCLIVRVDRDPEIPAPLTFRGVFDLTTRLSEDHEYWKLKGGWRRRRASWGVALVAAADPVISGCASRFRFRQPASPFG